MSPTEWELELHFVQDLSSALFNRLAPMELDLPPIVMIEENEPGLAEAIRAYSPRSLRVVASTHRAAAERAGEQLESKGDETSVVAIYRYAVDNQAHWARRYKALSEFAATTRRAIELVRTVPTCGSASRDADVAYALIRAEFDRSTLRTDTEPSIDRPYWDEPVDGPPFQPAKTSSIPGRRALARELDSTLAEVSPERASQRFLGKRRPSPRDFVTGHMLSTLRGVQRSAESEMLRIADSGKAAVATARLAGHCYRSEKLSAAYESAADAVTDVWRTALGSAAQNPRDKFFLLANGAPLGEGLEDFIGQVSEVAAKAAVLAVDPPWLGSSGHGFP